MSYFIKCLLRIIVNTYIQYCKSRKSKVVILFYVFGVILFIVQVLSTYSIKRILMAYFFSKSRLRMCNNI